MQWVKAAAPARDTTAAAGRQVSAHLPERSDHCRTPAQRRRDPRALTQRRRCRAGLLLLAVCGDMDQGPVPHMCQCHLLHRGVQGLEPPAPHSACPGTRLRAAPRAWQKRPAKAPFASLATRSQSGSPLLPKQTFCSPFGFPNEKAADLELQRGSEIILHVTHRPCKPTILFSHHLKSQQLSPQQLCTGGCSPQERTAGKTASADVGLFLKAGWRNIRDKQEMRRI